MFLLEQIVDVVAPGWGKVAVKRWEERQDADAAALVARAARHGHGA